MIYVNDGNKNRRRRPTNTKKKKNDIILLVVVVGGAFYCLLTISFVYYIYNPNIKKQKQKWLLFTEFINLYLYNTHTELYRV